MFLVGRAQTATMLDALTSASIHEFRCDNEEDQSHWMLTFVSMRVVVSVPYRGSLRVVASKSIEVLG